MGLVLSEEVPKNSGEILEKLSELFLGIALESTARNPQAL